MSFDPVLAAFRFGCGLSPVHPPPESAAGMIATLRGSDLAAGLVPIVPFAAAEPSPLALADAARARRAALGTPDEDAAREAERGLQRVARDVWQKNLLRTLARMAIAADGLRERLVVFWADHFTVRARMGRIKHLVTPFVEEAIRPHVTGRFPDMLRAVTTHPMMLQYLNQLRSHGPNSAAGLRRGRGLNENLARELLELHLLGAGGGYTQRDVRELAELLTGLTWQPRRGFFFSHAMAEPGAEEILGQSYGPEPSLAAIHDALDDLALRPETAQHLARKMAAHFVADAPDQTLVAAMASTYRESGGDLAAMTAAMLDHPAAWRPERSKVRWPIEYIAAGLRALAVTPDQLLALEHRAIRRLFLQPLQMMGQPWEAPPGPDGWPESADRWIIPQTLAARQTWALQVPARLVTDLPDPREFVETALGPDAPRDVRFAARAAERVSDGIGLVLAAPAFQRR